MNYNINIFVLRYNILGCLKVQTYSNNSAGTRAGLLNRFNNLLEMSFRVLYGLISACLKVLTGQKERNPQF